MKVFKNNITTFFTSSIRLFIAFVLPIIFVLLFVAGENGDIQRTITINDNDNTQLTQALTEEIDSSCIIVDLEEDEVMDALINAKIDYAISIPKGYTEKLLNGEEVFIEDKYFINEYKVYPLMQSIETYINNVINIYRISASENDFYNRLNEIENYSIEFKQKYLGSLSVHKTVSALGFIMQFIMYSGIIVTAMFLRDKESNSTNRILLSPMSMTGYLAEHFLSYIVIEALISIYLLAVLKWIFGYYFGGYFMLITVMLILFSVSIVAFCMLIVSVCKKSLASYWVLIILTTPMLIFGGCYFEIGSMPASVQNVSNLLPTKWMMDFARDVLIDNNLETTVITAIIIIAFALVYLSISRIGIKSLLQEK